MKRLRGETIFLPKSYKDAKKDALYCTIDLDECFDITLDEIENGIGENSDKENLIKQGIVAIKANTFGPYYPKEYFKESTIHEQFKRNFLHTIKGVSKNWKFG